MSELKFAVLDAARHGDINATQRILDHFEGYIASRCLRAYADEAGTERAFVDEELRQRATTALLESIYRFQYREPPDDFIE